MQKLHQQQPDAGHAAAPLHISERGRARSLLETLTKRAPTSARVLTPAHKPEH